MIPVKLVFALAIGTAWVATFAEIATSLRNLLPTH